MLKGGYQIIDLENRNFKNEVGIEIKGIYKKLESTKKPTILSGIKVNDVEMRDMFANFFIYGSAFVSNFNVFINNTPVEIIVIVNDNDVVQFAINNVE